MYLAEKIIIKLVLYIVVYYVLVIFAKKVGFIEQES